MRYQILTKEETKDEFRQSLIEIVSLTSAFSANRSTEVHTDEVYLSF